MDMKSRIGPRPRRWRDAGALGLRALVLVAAGLALSCATVPFASRSRVTVTGRVLAPSGAPLPGAEIAFEPSERMSGRAAFTTADSSGSYSVRLAPGRYDSRVAPPREIGILALAEPVVVSQGRARIDFTFGGYRVTGRVLKPDGSVVDSGLVHAILGGQGYRNAMSPTKEGRYSLLLPHGKYSFRAVAGGHWSGFHPTLRDSVAVDADTTIDFHLGGISVSGRVLGPDGLPMKDVGVEARSPVIAGIEVNRSYPVQNRTSADGRYQLYLPANSYSIWFRPPHPFFIVPRVVGPVTIAEPTSIDVDLAGIEWVGTVRRADTHEPAAGVSVTVKSADDERRAASIRSGTRGDFKFVLERGRRFDMEIHDPDSREQFVALQGVAASADTLLEILIPPTTIATRADSTIKLSIRASSGESVHRFNRRRPPDWIEVTLRNTDPDTVTLVLPGDGSFFGRRTPLMDWDIRLPGGARLERVPVLRCGNINPLIAEEVFRLPPGGLRTFRTAVPAYYRYEKSRRYRFRLSYENRPRLAWGGGLLGSHDSDALRLLRQSTRCRLVSNEVVLVVK